MHKINDIKTINKNVFKITGNQSRVNQNVKRCRLTHDVKVRNVTKMNSKKKCYKK